MSSQPTPVVRAVQLAQQRAASDLHHWPVRDHGSVEHQALITAHRLYCEALIELGVQPVCYMAAAIAEQSNTKTKTHERRIRTSKN